MREPQAGPFLLMGSDWGPIKADLDVGQEGLLLSKGGAGTTGRRSDCEICKDRRGRWGPSSSKGRVSKASKDLCMGQGQGESWWQDRELSWDSPVLGWEP